MVIFSPALCDCSCCWLLFLFTNQSTEQLMSWSVSPHQKGGVGCCTVHRFHHQLLSRHRHAHVPLAKHTAMRTLTPCDYLTRPVDPIHGSSLARSLTTSLCLCLVISMLQELWLGFVDFLFLFFFSLCGYFTSPWQRSVALMITTALAGFCGLLSVTWVGWWSDVGAKTAS